MRRARHHDLVMQRIEQQPHIDELTREQLELRIVEQCSQLERAGGGVDLVVRSCDSVPLAILLVRLRSIGVDAELLAAIAGAAGSSLRLSSGTVNSTDIGCICVTTTMVVRVRLHQVADVHLPQADAGPPPAR